MRVTFEEVRVKVTRRWTDPSTGKLRQETKIFLQTINPFNTAADGSIKSRQQIQAEINAEAQAWLQGA